jgi:hypothetical protein
MAKSIHPSGVGRIGVANRRFRLLSKHVGTRNLIRESKAGQDDEQSSSRSEVDGHSMLSLPTSGPEQISL